MVWIIYGNYEKSHLIVVMASLFRVHMSLKIPCYKCWKSALFLPLRMESVWNCHLVEIILCCCLLVLLTISAPWNKVQVQAEFSFINPVQIPIDRERERTKEKPREQKTCNPWLICYSIENKNSSKEGHSVKGDIFHRWKWWRILSDNLCIPIPKYYYEEKKTLIFSFIAKEKSVDICYVLESWQKGPQFE